MHKTTILHIIPTMDAGGAERQLSYLLRGLDRDKFALHLVVLKPGGIFAREIPGEVHTTLLEWNYKNLFKTVRFIRKYIKRERIDIVHSFLPTANLLALLALILIRNRPRFIASLRNSYSHYFDRYVFFNRLAFAFSDFVVANSGWVRENLLNFYKIRPNKAILIRNGFDYDSFAAKIDRDSGPESGFTFLFVGRFVKQKGISVLAEAIKIFNDYRKDVHYFFVGKGPLKHDFMKRIEECEMQGRVAFINTTDAVEAYYSKAKVFILPTFHEGLSNAVLEAMAAGIPVITTSIPANRELIENGKEGILVPAGDPSAFAEAMKRMVEEYEEAKKMGKRGAKKIKEQFSIEKMIEQYNDLYLERESK